MTNDMFLYYSFLWWAHHEANTCLCTRASLLTRRGSPSVSVLSSGETRHRQERCQRTPRPRAVTRPRRGTLGRRAQRGAQWMQNSIRFDFQLLVCISSNHHAFLLLLHYAWYNDALYVGENVLPWLTLMRWIAWHLVMQKGRLHIGQHLSRAYVLKIGGYVVHRCMYVSSKCLAKLRNNKKKSGTWFAKVKLSNHRKL